MSGCYSGGFLDDTCERLPGGCLGTTTTTGTPTTTGESTSSSSSTGADPTTGASTGTTGGLPGILIEGPAFRISTMAIVDPHLFLKTLACQDVHTFINLSLQTSIDQRDTNLILVAADYDPAAPTQKFLFYSDADCPEDQEYCLLLPAVLPTEFVSGNKDAGNCLAIDLSTVNPDHVLELNLPNAPCVVSPTASLPVQLSADLSPINFYLGRFAAQYSPGDIAPTSLINAVLHGFIPREDALKINYMYKDAVVNLWSVVRGGDHPEACPVPMDMMPGSVTDVDTVDLDGDGAMMPTTGVFLYMNFTAEKIDFYAPF